MPRRLLLLAVVTLGLVLPGTAAADPVCQLHAQPVASVLIIHGGGWTGGFAGGTADLCGELALLGYRARALEYPLGTVPGSIRYAQAAAAEEARSGRPVYALGTSAGGTVAEYLAMRGEVDGALAVAPVSDLLDWSGIGPGYWEGLGMTPAQRREWSPYYNVERPSPLRIVHSRADEVVPYDQSARMVAKCGAPCDLVPLDYGGPHAAMLIWQAIPALQWFQQRAFEPLSRAAPPAAPSLARAPSRSSWLTVASRAFPGHCRPVRLRYRPLPRSQWEQTSRKRCSVTLASRLSRRPAWVRCTAVVHAFAHLTARWSGRHSARRGALMYERILRPYRGARSRCPGR